MLEVVNNKEAGVRWIGDETGQYPGPRPRQICPILLEGSQIRRRSAERLLKAKKDHLEGAFVQQMQPCDGGGRSCNGALGSAL